MKPNKPKILLITHDLSITGAPNSLLRQAKYFLSSGFEVDVWAVNSGGLLSKYKEAGVQPVILHANSYFAINRAWKRHKKDYNLIICNTIETYKFADFFQYKNIPLVWFIRETFLVDNAVKNNKHFSDIFSNFYNLYTVSDYSAKNSQKYNKKIRVINNAVEDRFSNFSTPGKDIRFGYIGSINELKGIDILINSFTQSVKKHPNITLKIAGNFNTKLGRILYKNSEAISNINWLGEIENKDKQNFFDNIDVLVVPSLDEASGLTVIEGAMYGKVLITTENVGANYLVKDGVNGCIAKVSDVASLSQKIDFLVNRPIEIIKKMQEESRNLYLKYGTVNHEKDAVLQMYEDNKNNFPHTVLKEDKLKYFYESSVSNSGSKKQFYLLGLKIFSKRVKQ